MTPCILARMNLYVLEGISLLTLRKAWRDEVGGYKGRIALIRCKPILNVIPDFFQNAKINLKPFDFSDM